MDGALEPNLSGDGVGGKPRLHDVEQIARKDGLVLPGAIGVTKGCPIQRTKSWSALHQKLVMIVEEAVTKRTTRIGMVGDHWILKNNPKQSSRTFPILSDASVVLEDRTQITSEQLVQQLSLIPRRY